MGTNKRYGEQIDQGIAARRAAALPATPPWHPRLNVYPTSWICRNGRWGTIYGAIDMEDVRRNGLSAVVYHATTITEGVRVPLGTYDTGDAAAEALWAVFIERVHSKG